MPGVLTRGPGPVTVWLVLSTVSPGWLAAQSLDRPLFQEVERWGRVVAPGVEHVRLTGRAGPDAAPWRAHLFRVDLRRSRLEVALALVGGPVVARDGIVRASYDREAYPEGFLVDRHARTAVGLSRDGDTVFLLTIDGRGEGYSAGATPEELGALLVREGAALVYNLDGGGSTAMVVEGRVANRPSGGRERRVPDVVLIFPR